MLFYFIITIITSSYIYPNSIELMIDEIISSKNQISKDEILEFSKMISDDSDMNILKGLLENNGDLSKEYFISYLNEFSKSTNISSILLLALFGVAFKLFNEREAG